MKTGTRNLELSNRFTWRSVVVLGVAVLLAGSAGAASRWSVVGPPFEVRAMAVDPHDNRNLFTGRYGTMAHSEDGGTTWTVTPISGLVGPSAIRVAFSISSTVYVLGLQDLYRSTTAGTTWVARTVPIPGFPHDLQVDARNADTLVLGASDFCFLGCQGAGVYRSTNGGGSWRSIGLKNVGIFHVALDPTASGVIYAASETTLFKTTNGGNSWIPITPMDSGSILGVIVDPVVPTIVYTAASSGIFRSSDAGQTWELLRAAEYGALIDVAPDNSRWLFTSGAGTALSADTGKTWQDLTTAGSGLTLSQVWQVMVSRDTCFIVADIAGAPGKILAYDLRQSHRRAAPGR
jgi:photosystem II stability/assembly factor-like uncharacterized protein